MYRPSFANIVLFHGRTDVLMFPYLSNNTNLCHWLHCATTLVLYVVFVIVCSKAKRSPAFTLCSYKPISACQPDVYPKTDRKSVV